MDQPTSVQIIRFAGAVVPPTGTTCECRTEPNLPPIAEPTHDAEVKKQSKATDMRCSKSKPEGKTRDPRGKQIIPQQPFPGA